MAQNDVGHLIVVSGHNRKKLGIVTIKDLLKARRLHVEDESSREIMFPIISRRKKT
jgi:predicted transcriptional regulator